VVELGGETRLPKEALDHIAPRQVSRVEDLDDGLSREQRLLGAEHRAKPAFADLLLDDEVAQCAARQPCQ
jgi:hypothetical protein